MTSKNKCETIPCNVFMRMRGTDKMYLEALEASSKFNRRLLTERKTRIPFIDSQTRVAQTNSILWYQTFHRENVQKNEHVYTYPVKTWLKKRRLQIDNDLNIARMPSYESTSHQINENSNSTDSMQPFNKYNAGMNGMNMDQDAGVVDDWHMQDDGYDYYNENNDDNDSDFDDYEDSKRNKKRKSKIVKKRSEIPNDEKPFECEKCGVKYKTKPGLTYHVQKMHSKNSNSSNTREHHAVTVAPNLNPHAMSHQNASRHLSHHLQQQPSHMSESLMHNDNSSHLIRSSSHMNPDENTNSLLDGANEDSNQPSISSSTASATHVSTAQTKFLTKVCQSCNYGPIDDPGHRQRNGGDSQMVSCSECTKSYHPICLNFTPNMIISTKKYNWQCIECKKCVVCGNSENDDKLLFCDDCDRGYHMYCLNPPLSEAPDGDWRCNLCVQEFGV